MKPVIPDSLSMSDRLATWNEIHTAMSFRPSGAFELRCTCDGYCEMRSDMYGWIRVLKRDLECWASAGFMNSDNH